MCLSGLSKSSLFHAELAVARGAFDLAGIGSTSRTGLIKGSFSKNNIKTGSQAVIYILAEKFIKYSGSTKHVS